MSEHRVSLRMEPVPAEFQAVYRRRGMEPPEMSSPHSPAALWPVEPRWRHRLYALRHGYYWLACVLCGRSHGGHEITGSIPDPTNEHMWMQVCPYCTAQRNGGKP